MTDTKLWKILHNDTIGWTPIEELGCEKLTKERCEERLEELMREGYNPNHLRAVPDV